jgi:hypothetical protein
MPNGAEYLMAVSTQLDATGDWIPSRIRTAANYYELQKSLREIVGTDGAIVIHGSGKFMRLAQELGMPMLTAEWGKP